MDLDGPLATRRANRQRAREQLRVAWRTSGWYSDTTVGEALAAGARTHPADRIVFERVDGDVTALTLAELFAKAQATAAALRSAGTAPGDPVIVQAAADAEGTEAMMALWILGAAVVPIVTTASSAELAHVVRETGATTMLVARSWRDMPLAETARTHRDDWGLTSVIVLGDRLSDLDATGDTGDNRLTGSQFGGHGASDPRPSPADVACVLYTSGSTGFPKGVQHSHETLLAGLDLMPAAASDTRTLTSFPAGHVASIIGLLRPLTVGGTTVVMDRWSARRAAEIVEEYAITMSAGTPFYLATLLDEAERSGRDISTLDRFLVGAATVPPALVARAEAAGIVTWRTYGSTEHPAISGGTPDDPPEKRRLTDGKVGPGNEVRLVDELGDDVEPGAEGEILAGPRQFLGYRDEALDDEAFADDGWFRTGDQGRFDADGHLVITDRLKDLIIRGGENISAREIEDVLAEHPDVDEVAVCAAPDETWGEVPCAFVRFRPDRSADIEELRALAVQVGLAAHKLPVHLVTVGDFPRTAAGKVRKRDLRPLLPPT